MCFIYIRINIRHVYRIYRKMLHQHEDILKCLRNRSVTEITRFRFPDNPSFLTAMGPSRDGIIIPSAFGLDQGSLQTQRRGGVPTKPFFMKSRSTRKLRSQDARSYEVILYKYFRKLTYIFHLQYYYCS